MPKADKADTTEPELCSEPVDERGIHIYNCSSGTSRFRLHRALLLALARLLKKAGAHVDLERACPDLFKLIAPGRNSAAANVPHSKEAILDIVVALPGSLHQQRIDVTIRSPVAASRQHADTRVGTAAVSAEIAKRVRYDPTVLPLAFEACGRLGQASIGAFSFLQQEATVLGHAAFEDQHAARFQHWRRELEAVVAYQPADATLLCWGRPAQCFTTLLAR